MTTGRERIEIELHRPWALMALVVLLLAGGWTYLIAHLGTVVARDGDGLFLLWLAVRVVVAVAALVVIVGAGIKYLRHPAFRLVLDDTALTLPSWKKGQTIETIPWKDIVALHDAPPRLVIVTVGRPHYLHRIWFRAPWSLAAVRAEIEKRRADA